MQSARRAFVWSSEKYSQAKATRAGKATGFLWRHRKKTAVGLSAVYVLLQYRRARIAAIRRDLISDETILLWKIHDGSIVEQISNASTLSMLMQSQNGAPEEPPRVMTLWQVLRTLKYAAADERIKGIVADFSHESLPQVPAYSLGLAQIEELLDAIDQLKQAKEEQLGKGVFRTAAFADTFVSQGDYLLASAFDKIYIQPSGEIALVGLSATISFYSRLLEWLGVKVHAETRNEYKSVVAPYVSEELSAPQRENEIELLADLHENMCRGIAANRFGDIEIVEGARKVKDLAHRGPFSASEAIEAGLIDGTGYRRQVIKQVLGHPEEDVPSDEEVAEKETKQAQLKGFYHYARTMEKVFEKVGADNTLDVGVIYLLGGIDTGGGEFGTTSVLKGLREAAADDDIGAVVLRIDSGGGAVVPSDTIHNAVRELQEKGKIVVASFANAAASGGYLVCTHADAIVANPSTITGSIGVAAMRPTVTQKLLDRVGVTVQSFFNGSKAVSLFHPLEGAEEVNFKKHVDEHYADFKHRVAEGRSIDPEVIEHIAGGRVMTGSKAYSLIDQGESEAVAAGSATNDALQAVEAAAGDSAGQSPAQLPLPASLLEMFRRSYGAPAEAPERYNPLGRGLVDGLGGIADAAVLAAEMFLSKAVQQTQLNNPGMSPEDAMQELLPDMPYNAGADGTMQLQLDVNLKRFPVERSFWATLVEQSLRGDGIDPTSVSTSLRLMFTTALARALAGEMERLGLASMSRDLAALASSTSGRGGVRLEEPLVKRVRI